MRTLAIVLIVILGIASGIYAVAVFIPTVLLVAVLLPREYWVRFARAIILSPLLGTRKLAVAVDRNIH